MSRLKQTVYANKEATTSNSPQPPPQQPSLSSMKTLEEIFHYSRFLPMKSNNPRINLHTFKCPNEIIPVILKHHSMCTMFFAHPRVPQFYLQQLWATVKHRNADPNQKFEKDECLVGRLESSDLELTLPMIRAMLKLPGRDQYEEFPSEENLLKDVTELEYDGEPASIASLDWNLIAPLWCTLLGIICNCLTHKETDQDYATKRCL